MLNKGKGRLRIRLDRTGNHNYLKLIGEFNDHCYAKLELTDYQFKRAFQCIVDSEFILKMNREFYEDRIRLLENRIKILEGKDKENGNGEKKII